MEFVIISNISLPITVNDNVDNESFTATTDETGQLFSYKLLVL